MTDTKWEMRFHGQSIYDGMLADIEAAKKSIALEQFSFHDDEVGRPFLEAFERKLKQGVEIRIIADAWNSANLFDSPYFKKLALMGLKSQAFNPLNVFTPRQNFFHTHKKTLVVDGELAWVGGIGLKKKFKNFRDTQIRLVGPVVSEVLTEFDFFWTHPQQTEDFFEPVTSAVKSMSDSDFQFLVHRPGFQKKEIYEWIREHLLHAEKRIYFTVSYFYPDRNFFQLILDKARAGVDVRIILRGKDDEFAPIRFSASYFKLALENGIKIYKYLPTILHAKTLIVDDWATVGSCNLDKFSFYYNAEANVVSKHPEFVADLLTQFHEDLKSAQQVTLERWQGRPWRERVYEALLWPIHDYL